MPYYGYGPTKHERPTARSAKEVYGQYIEFEDDRPWYETMLWPVIAFAFVVGVVLINVLVEALS